MRILFAIHHPVDERLGAPGASIAVARNLERSGHEVEFFCYDHAYPGTTDFDARHQLVFPWKLANYLRRNSRRLDVLDITTGDAYLWARLGRPGARPGTAVVTRSSGIEHLEHQERRAAARAGELKLSWRYPLYNGGFRLWEVAQSVRASDCVLTPTEYERRFLIDELRADPNSTCVVPYGIDDSLLRTESIPDANGTDGRGIRLCFMGSWIFRKGIDQLVSTVDLLVAAGTPFHLLIAGSGASEDEVLASFCEGARGRIEVIPRFERGEVADLLADRDVILFPSRSEGFGIALLEAMACGVAPIATPVGVASSIIQDGVNGVFVGVGETADTFSAIESLAKHRSRLHRMRAAASMTAAKFTWRRTADATLGVYELARKMRQDRGQPVRRAVRVLSHRS